MDPLLQRAGSPSYTPGRRDIQPLLELLAAGAGDHEEAALRAALCRRPELAVPAAVARLGGAEVEAGAAGRLIRLLGQLAGAQGVGAGERGAIGAALIGRLDDGDAGTRRRAAVALGKLGAGAAEAEAALLRRLESGDRADVVRAVIEALGLVGGEAAAVALAERRGRGGDEVQTIEAALLRIKRTVARPAESAESAIDAEAVPVRAVRVRLHCRSGLEGLLDEELRSGEPPTLPSPLRGEGMLRTKLSALFASRLWTEIGFPLPAAADAAAAITSAEGMAVLRGFTRGLIRYRIAFVGGGHRRAEVRAIARAVAERAPDLINDPTRTDWEAVIDDRRAGAVTVELRPRGLVDPRFGYRVTDVPAASHPTIAAALARVAFLHAPDPAGDVVWDPFCGSGLELIERARLGPARRLVGMDTAPAALDAARANLAVAGVGAELSIADALFHDPGGVTTIITNPPMGRRVARGESVDLLDRFVARAGALLPPGGRLVWIAPSPRRTDAAAAAARLEVRSRHPIDMGGFSAELQLLVRR